MRTKTSRRAGVVAGVLAAAGLLAACSSGGGGLGSPSTLTGPPDRPDPGNGSEVEGLVFVAALRQVGDCDALLAHLRAEASKRVGPYGLGTGPIYYGVGGGAAVAEDGRAGASAPTLAGEGDASARGAAQQGDGSFSGTNVQEEGVDEPDIVKTDGTRIVTLSNGVLSVVDPASGQRTGWLRLASDTGYPADILLAGDKVLVFGNEWVSDDAGNGGASGDARIGFWAPGRQLATITEVDISNPASPATGATLRTDGWYVTSRQNGDTVRVVLRSEPVQLPFVYPQTQAGEDRAEAVNREVVEQSTLEDWLPSYELLDSGGASVARGLLADCQSVNAPTEFAGFGSLSVLTFDTSRTIGDGDAVSVLAGGDTVYASHERLYVATNTYIDPLVVQEDPDAATRLWNGAYATSIHAFDIAGSTPARHLASGSVPGYLIGQFAMSEHEGRLRAASTKGVPWNGEEQSESMITVLEQRGGELVQVGQVGNMGQGERIYAVRYAGAVAYLVTFRQVDPFYTVDLSDPAAPRVVGELKIPGYSSYLHPIGDGLVVGVGQAASDDGRTQGTKVSLFDVTDLGAPVEIATWTLEDSGSAVEWDHHAFLWWPATNQLVLPVSKWSFDGDYDAGFFGAVVLTLDRSGIVEVGRVEHPRVTPNTEDWCGRPVEPLADEGGGTGVSYPECVVSPQPDMIQRSLVIGDTLWTLGYWTIQSQPLADLAPGASIRID